MPLPVIYIKLYSNKISMVNLKNGLSASGESGEPFSSQHLLIAEMLPAIKLGDSLLRKVHFRKWLPFLRPNYKAVVHPCQFLDRTFSSVEKVSFFDLAEQLGASDVTICTSRSELSLEEARRQFSS